MKYGLLNFSYSNFDHFEKQFRATGEYSINLGDYMQTIAVAGLYRTWGIAADQIVRLDRDTLPSYDGNPVALIMNGCFYRWCFPLPATITPIFIGFQAEEQVIVSIASLLKRHEPIGCRDVRTASLCQKYDISAYTTGCLTATFPHREAQPSAGKTFLSYGLYGGMFPAQLLKSIPDRILDSHLLEFISQRKTVRTYPLDLFEMELAENDASFLLAKYRREASLVITSLHHAATPCMSSGIPVIVCRSAMDDRFSLLQTWTNIYLPHNFDKIDWSPPAADMTEIRRVLTSKAKALVEIQVS